MKTWIYYCVSLQPIIILQWNVSRCCLNIEIRQLGKFPHYFPLTQICGLCCTRVCFASLIIDKWASLSVVWLCRLDVFCLCSLFFSCVMKQTNTTAGLWNTPSRFRLLGEFCASVGNAPLVPFNSLFSSSSLPPLKRFSVSASPDSGVSWLTGVWLVDASSMMEVWGSGQLLSLLCSSVCIIAAAAWA